MINSEFKLQAEAEGLAQIERGDNLRKEEEEKVDDKERNSNIKKMKKLLAA